MPLLKMCISEKHLREQFKEWTSSSRSQLSFLDLGIILLGIIPRGKHHTTLNNQLWCQLQTLPSLWCQQDLLNWDDILPSNLHKCSIFQSLLYFIIILNFITTLWSRLGICFHPILQISKPRSAETSDQLNWHSWESRPGTWKGNLIFQLPDKHTLLWDLPSWGRRNDFTPVTTSTS